VVRRTKATWEQKLQETDRMDTGYFLSG